jgi:hypothetical protein
MPEERRQRLLKAVKAAETMVDMCLRSQQVSTRPVTADIVVYEELQTG